MNVLLVQAMDPSKQRETYLPPLGLASIAATLREKCGIENIVITDTRSVGSLGAFRPDIAGISSVTQNYSIAARLAADLKARYDIPIIVGGVHISALPESLSRDMDIGVIGEGEQTMLEIVRAFQSTMRGPDALRSICGIVFRDGEQLVLTPPRQLIRPLDSLPHPAWDLLRIEPFAHLVTSRGCPCRCAFCSSSRMWQVLRCHSAAYVVQEIRTLVERYDVRRINLMDDLFSADRTRLRQIADAVVSEGLNRKVYFACHGRAEFVDEEICTEMRRMGVESITFGFESGSQRILSYLKKGAATVEGNLRAARICRQAGLRVGGSFIIGSPGETRDDVMQTYEFIRKSGIIGGDVYVLIPYPGTEVWEYAKQRGLVSDRMDWSTLQTDSFEARKDIVLTDEIGADELLQLHRMIQLELKNMLAETSRYLYAREYRLGNLFSLTRLLRAIREPGKAFSFLRDILRYRFLGKGMTGGRG